MTVELVHITQTASIRTLTLDSPPNRNALSSALVAELADGLADAAADASVRVIVLTATGTSFCGGADLSEGATSSSSRLPEILDTMRRAPQPVIARVNGHARGGGIGLVAAADLAVATAAASFAFSEVRVGVAPAMILVPALRVADPRFLTRMTLTGERFSAAEAVQAGLLTAVTDDEAALDHWVHEAADAVLAAAPGAVAATKQLLADLPALSWSDGLHSAQRRSAELFAGPEAAEGRDAFLHKRQPSWQQQTP